MVGVAKAEIALVAGLFLGVGALGVSLRSSQRDTDFRSEIIYVPVSLTKSDFGPTDGATLTIDLFRLQARDAHGARKI
jgi:hypothetical protein